MVATMPRLWNTVNSTEFYLAPPESFALVLEHSISGFQKLEGFSGITSGQALSGWLERPLSDVNETDPVPDRVRITSTDPNDPAHLAQFPKDGRVILPLSEMLGAANITLEDVCAACHSGPAKGPLAS